MSTPAGGSTWSSLHALLLRELRLAWRRRVDALMPQVFFVAAASLFPLGVGPEAQTLRTIAPGVLWVGALLATMLSVAQLYAADHADGSLEQLLLSGLAPSAVAAAKALAHWLVTGAPLLVAAPVLGLMFGLGAGAVGMLVLTLALGTPVLSLLGGLGAALTLGLRNGGMLLIVVVLPLAIPTLIFGAAAVAAVEAGLSARGHLSLLGAVLILTALFAPVATGAALRIATE
ncbi:MAG TPA: heme exporter protein CcmB [Methylibium sp.]|uniref:heme exporter protein CcmB n=1 Tax=Methylibium sp. TaxID=2067992 RepID=UPI002DBB852C|nr:heme exporter protein CcmB [Methylibium sp.]HEU4457872.1 heme exporter protein CcmB [Methylibium sp.]